MDAKHVYCGKSPRFWIKQLSKLISSGLYSPSRGHLGEVAAALCMLLCGDELRYTKDSQLTTFSVSLVQLLCKMEDKANNAEQSTEQIDLPTVSFVQVTRNELQVGYTKEYMVSQQRLKRPYESGQLAYVHEGCVAIDTFGSAKVSAAPIRFAPILISIKCRAKFAVGNQK